MVSSMTVHVALCDVRILPCAIMPGDYLTTHPLVNCISFTGGDTGIDICKKASMIPLQMELGGKVGRVK